MKRFLILLSLLFSSVVFAATETINWYMDGNTYATTTCQTGGDIVLPTAPTKYGYTFNGWKGYTPIEYLESTGTQYIDTGILQSQFVGNLILRAIFQPSTVLCGEHLASLRDNGIFYPLLIRNGYYMTNIWGGGGEKNLAQLDYNKHTITVNASDGNILFDDKQFAFSKSSASIATNIIIFGNNNIETGVMLKSCYKLYGLSLSDSNNVLLRDFIPVLDDSGVACLFDKVENKFYYNAGTGQFVAGPIINQ